MRLALNQIILVISIFLSTIVSAAWLPHAETSFRLIGYWQNFTNTAQTPVRLTDIPSGYKIIIIAFADIAANGQVSFTLQGPPYTTMDNGMALFKKDIQTIQANGTKVLLALGGQNGFYQIDTPQKAAQFSQSLSQLILTYGFDGIDYDFENGLTASNASYLLETTSILKKEFAAEGKNLFFSIAPETIDVYWQVFPNGKYDQLIQSGLIDLVQVQLYNSGCMPGSQIGSRCYTQGTQDFIVSQADSTIQTWIEHGFPNAASHYAIGLPATVAAAGGGYTDPLILQKAIVCLKTKSQCDSYVPKEIYPGLNNIMTWSINWDAKNNYQFENNISHMANSYSQ